MENKTRQEAVARGELYFFTGKCCKRGHIAKRYVGNGGCYECMHPTRAITIAPIGEVLSPSSETTLAVRSELDQTKLALIDRKLSIEERKLALKELRVEDRTLRLQDRAERIARRERQSVVHGKMVDVPLFISVVDYDNVINVVWAFAMMRDPRILRVDVVTGRERDAGVREKAYICRCFPEDKLEIIRIAEEIRQRNYPLPTPDPMNIAKALAMGDGDDGEWPADDPR